MLVFGLSTSQAFAQDSMDFGVDEVEDDEDDADEAGDDDGTMSFGADEVDEEEEGDAGDDDSYSLAVLVLPSDHIDRNQRIELQDKMREAVGLDPNYDAQDGAEILNGLEEMGVNECVTETLCLAGVGQDVGVDRVLLGTIKQDGGSLTLNVDLFDVEEKLFVKYTTKRNLSGYSAVEGAVEPAMRDIFDIRVDRDGPNYGEETDGGTVQTVLAYSTAALAVGSLATGIYFGMDASSQEDDILANKDEDGQFTISQVEAERMRRDADSSALTANVLYGTAAGMAIISGVLFYVEGGSDVAEPTERRRRSSLFDAIELRPSVGAGKVGFGASIDF
ncbi:MAG: hypothetical protein ACOC9J_01625 [Persicimonas sp.]